MDSILVWRRPELAPEDTVAALAYKGGIWGPYLGSHQQFWGGTHIMALAHRFKFKLLDLVNEMGWL